MLIGQLAVTAGILVLAVKGDIGNLRGKDILLENRGGQLVASVETDTARVHVPEGQQTVTAEEATTHPESKLKQTKAPERQKTSVSTREPPGEPVRGTRLLGPGDDLARYVSGSDGLLASLGNDGILDLYIKAGPTTPRGGQMFNEALQAYGSNVKGIRGTWIGGGDIASNFDSFKAALNAGLSPEQAALATFTGKMSARAGFTKVTVIRNDARRVVVEFRK